MSALTIPNHTTTSIIQSVQITGVAPAFWRIMELLDDTYELQFQYADEPVGELWLPIVKRNQESKNYKSIKAVFSDIKKMTEKSMDHPVIHYYGNKS